MISRGQLTTPFNWEGVNWTIDPPITWETMNTRKLETCQTQLKSHQWATEVYRRNICPRPSLQPPSFCPPLYMHADTMMDTNAFWRAAKKIQEGRERKWETIKRSISACWKSKISTWAAEQCQRPSMPPWLPSSHIVAVLSPHTLLQKIQQLVCYFYNWKNQTRLYIHKLYNSQTCSIGLFLLRYIYTQGYSKSGWSWQADE